MTEKAARTGNAILASLTAGERSRLLDVSERVSVETGNVISSPECDIDHVYLPETAVLSILSVMRDRSGVETAVVGNDGLAPLAPFNGVTSSAEQIVAQVPGETWRLSRAAFERALQDLPSLSPALHRYSQALFTMAAQNSGCNRKHTVVQRCARWLLLTHDRVPGDEFSLTHLFLAQMLGVRRSSVTIAAEALRDAGAITYTRGRVRIVDRSTLLAHSCECYAIIRSSYDRLVDLQGAPTPSPLRDLVLSDHGQSLTHSGDTDRRDSPAGLRAVTASGTAIAEMRAKLRNAMELSQALQTELESPELSGEDMKRASELLSRALNDLQHVEEELQLHLGALA